MLETEKEGVVSGVEEIMQLFMWHLEAVRKCCFVKIENAERSLGVHKSEP